MQLLGSPEHLSRQAMGNHDVVTDLNSKHGHTPAGNACSAAVATCPKITR